MINKCIFTFLIFLFITLIYNVYNFEYLKSYPLSNEEFLLINDKGIYSFNKKSLIKKEKHNFENKDEKIFSDKDIDNIFIFENKETLLIFIKSQIYVFSSVGDFIKKTEFDFNLREQNYLILPYKSILNNNSYKFYYVIMHKGNENSIIINLYEYDYSSNKISVIFNNRMNLTNILSKEIINDYSDFTCQIMNGKTNKDLMTFFVTDKKYKILMTNHFEININDKKIINLKSIKPQNISLSEGKIIKSVINKEKTKVLIYFYSKVNKYNFIIFDSIKNEFIEKNYSRYFNLKSCLNKTLNIGYIKNKYIIYCICLNQKIYVIELNKDFDYEANKIFEFNELRSFKENMKNNILYIDSIPDNYPLFFHYNRNDNIDIISKELNHYRYSKKTNISGNILKKKEEAPRKNKRKLQEGGIGGSPSEQASGTSLGGGQGEPMTPNSNPGSDPNSGNGNSTGSDTGANPNPGTGGDNDPNNNSEPGEEGGTGGMNSDKKGSGKTKDGYEFDFDDKNTNIPKNEIKDNRGSIMNNTKPGETYDLKGDGYEIKVAPMGQKEAGSTSIEFLDCESKLRQSYNLGNSTLTVFQTELETSSQKSLTNKIQYVVYDENNTELNLSVCSDEPIRINYALKQNSTFDMDMYSKFSEKGIDILNSSDSFFNDICYSYSDGGSDMILSDRIAEIYQNYSLCDNGCEYEGIEGSGTENLTVSCSCSISSDDSDDDDEDVNIKDIVLGLFEDSTFGVVKCYKLVFSFSNKNKNIGFWVFLIIAIGHIPLYVLFFLNGTKPIKKFIIKEMEKYHYLTQFNIENPPPKRSDINNKEMENNNDEFRKSENFNFAKNTNETMNKEENQDTDQKINYVLPDIVPKNENIRQRIKLSNGKDFISNDLIGIANNTAEKEEGEKNNDIIKVYSKKSINEKANAYILIQLDANNPENREIPPESNYIFDIYEYETALKYEKRAFLRILYILMLSKDNILNTFILKSPLELQPLRICLLLFAYTSDLALNTLFYFSDNISDKYHYSGNNLFWYTLFNNILISVISTVLSLILGGILNMMTNSKKGIEEEFKEEEKKMRENEKYTVSEERKKDILEKIQKSLKCLKIKMIIFVIIDFIIIIFFFYFVTSFCEVYQNTQTSWISDAIVSIIISFLIELAISLGVTIIYMLSLKYKKKNLYKISMLLA